MSPRGVRLVIVVPIALITSSFFLSPFLLPYGAVTGLDGVPLITDYRHIWSDMGIVPSLSYRLGDILCHQEAGRSMVINGSQMPICVRDTFIALGFLMCAIVLLVHRVDLRKRDVLAILAITAVLMFSDHTIQMVLGLNVPVTRAITGMLFGIACYVTLDAWIRYHEPGSEGQLY